VTSGIPKVMRHVCHMTYLHSSSLARPKREDFKSSIGYKSWFTKLEDELICKGGGGVMLQISHFGILDKSRAHVP